MNSSISIERDYTFVVRFQHGRARCATTVPGLLRHHQCIPIPFRWFSDNFRRLLVMQHENLVGTLDSDHIFTNLHFVRFVQVRVLEFQNHSGAVGESRGCLGVVWGCLAQPMLVGFWCGTACRNRTTPLRILIQIDEFTLNYWWFVRSHEKKNDFQWWKSRTPVFTVVLRWFWAVCNH